MWYQAGNVSHKKIYRPFRRSDSDNLKEESPSYMICKSEPLSNKAEALTRKFRADKVEVRHKAGFNSSCVCTVIFTSRFIYAWCAYLSISQCPLWNPAYGFHSWAKSACSCKHTKESDCHNASCSIRLFAFYHFRISIDLLTCFRMTLVLRQLYFKKPSSHFFI